MKIISERINGQFNDVSRAIDENNKEIIHELAKKHVALGADILDINTGPGRKNAADVMKWLVETVCEVTDVELAIDSPKMDVIEIGLRASKNPLMINSTTAEQEKMDRLFPLAGEFNADIICLTMDKGGIPSEPDKRAELAMVMLSNAMMHGIGTDKVYIDPLVLPVSASQLQCASLLKAMDMFQMLSDPAPNTVVGLSNVSNNTKERSLINRVYLAMLMSHGLTSAIMDPEDRELMNAMKTGEILLNQKLYADNYLMG